MPQEYFPIMGVKDSQNNREFMMTTTRELRTTEITRLCGRSFDGSVLDSNYWTSTLATGGTASQSGGKVSLVTTTSSGSSSKVVSTDLARYTASASNLFRWTGRFVTAPVANNVRRFGAYDDSNGFFFQLTSTAFSIGYRNATVDTLINSGSFNGNIALTYDPSTDTHAYEIVYGVGTMEFYIDGVLLHKLTSSTDPLTSMYTFPLTMECVNTGAVTGAPQLDCRGASISRLGEHISSPNSTFINTAATTTIKLGAGVLHRIIYGTNVNGSSLTIYDNSAGSGLILARLTPNTANTPMNIEFGLAFNVGLTIVSVNTGSWTVIYE